MEYRVYENNNGTYSVYKMFANGDMVHFKIVKTKKMAEKYGKIISK